MHVLVWRNTQGYWFLLSWYRTENSFVLVVEVLQVVWNTWYWIWTFHKQIFIRKLAFLSGCAHMKYLSHPPIQHWLRPSMTQWAHHSCFKIFLFKCKVSNLISDCSKEFICSSWLSLLSVVVFWENTLYFLGLVASLSLKVFLFLVSVLQHTNVFIGEL